MKRDMRKSEFSFECLGPDSFGGRDVNFNCLPDGHQHQCPLRKFLHNDILYGDNSGEWKCTSPKGEREVGDLGGPGDFSKCDYFGEYRDCKFFISE
ncbi:hypothetical protein HN832_00145 [archaeon]|nr:hypothetical protein [archaeon]MBT4373654.1 hypothetical protein [archaeon]MBT4531708.1 hypothetical protein [archaeon]MBT7001820.1 hypothetical protein [archaeon]MBT7281805.1 hypothetical protein [archaeon]